MLKFLIIFFGGLWLIMTVSRFFLRSLFGRAQQQQFRQQQQTQHRQRRSSGDINVDYSPNKGRKNKSSNDYKGGDYIDYEEVD